MLKRATVLFLMTFSPSLFAQRVNPHDLFGEWTIVGYKSRTLITPGMENSEERKERLLLFAECSKGAVFIDTTGISTSNQALDFDICSCGLIHRDQAILEIVKNDYSNGYSSSFDIDIDNKRVSDDFFALLDADSSRKLLRIIQTDCRVDYGQEKLKICIVNKNKIGLSRDYDLIILERKKRKPFKQHLHK